MKRAGAMSAMAVAAAMLLGAAPAERVVRIGETAAITVNGVARRLRIDPGSPGLVLLAPDYAEQAKLKGGGMLGFGVGYRVGGTVVFGKTAVAHVALGEVKPGKRRIAWTAKPFAAGVDAVMGPAGLDEPVVRFALHAPVPGERTVALDLVPNGWLFTSWFPLDATMMLGGEPVRVRFAPYSRRTIATATLARRLASQLGGRLGGAATNETIAFGIERPVRMMTLARPFAVGPLALTSLGMRTADTGSVATIPEETDAPPAAADPDEVVVTAKSRRKPAPGRLTLGADQLDRCSTIVFDKPARQIRLTCR